MARFPRFYYSTTRADGAAGSIVYHMNFPRFVVFINQEAKTFWIDFNAPESAKARAFSDYEKWWKEWQVKIKIPK